MAVSLGLGAAAALGLAAVHYDPPWAPIILVAAPLAQIAATLRIARDAR